MRAGLLKIAWCDIVPLLKYHNHHRCVINLIWRTRQKKMTVFMCVCLYVPMTDWRTVLVCLRLHNLTFPKKEYQAYKIIINRNIEINSFEYKTFLCNILFNLSSECVCWRETCLWAHLHLFNISRPQLWKMASSIAAV